MKVGKVFLVTAVLAFTSIMILAFLPVSSRRYRIEFDEAKIEGKRDYLEEITRSDLPQKQERSNILFILADDLGKTDISLYGGRSADTPHINAIGKHGAIFTDAYCTSAICSPSRAAIMTETGTGYADILRE